MSRELDELEREFADLEPGGDGGRGDSGGPRRGGPRILPIAVAVIALAAFGAIVWYAYNQGVRSGSEEAAPLLAPEGSAKVQPQDPGGMEVPHTDKQVYNRISGEEEEGEERVERILPPPEDPMQPPPPEPEASAQAESAPPAVETPELSATAESTREAAPAPEEPPLPDEKLAAPVEDPPTAAPADAESSAPPEPEPAAEPAPEPEPEAEPTQQAAADPAGAWRVQIAALRTEADARAAWDRLQSAHSDQLGGLTLSIQQAEVNGTNYFRVRGGPLENRAAAKAICDALAAEDQGCLVVKPGG